MKKLHYQKLTEFLIANLPERYHRHFYSWMQNGKMINEGKQVTETGVEIAQIEYQAVYFFDQLPFKSISPYWLLALIQTWLNNQEQDEWPFREPNIPFEIDMIDDNTAEFTITIDFREPITAKKDKSGNLNIHGETYRLDEIEINIAEEFNLVAKVG